MVEPETGDLTSSSSIFKKGIIRLHVNECQRVKMLMRHLSMFAMRMYSFQKSLCHLKIQFYRFLALYFLLPNPTMIF